MGKCSFTNGCQQTEEASIFAHVSILVQCTTAPNDTNGFIFPGNEGNFQERFTQLYEANFK